MAVLDGKATATNAGDVIRVSDTDVWVYWAYIVALKTNAGYVHLGGSTVDGTTGAPLTAGDSVPLPPNRTVHKRKINLHDYWVWVENAGEGVSWFGED